MDAHLTHLFMEVAELQRARWFWTEAIGLQLLDDRGVYIAVGGNGGFAIGIEQVAAERVSAAGPELTVRVDDVDAVAERLAGLEIEIIRRARRHALGVAPRVAARPGRPAHVDLLFAGDGHERARDKGWRGRPSRAEHGDCAYS